MVRLMTTSDTAPQTILAAGDTFLHTVASDPRVGMLLDALEHEYDERYHDFAVDAAYNEIHRFSDDTFSPPNGTFLLLLRDGVAIAGGAFMTADASTVEFKRIWTHPDHRGRGLARLVLLELEREAARRGFAEVILSTGPRQPEAVRLYLATGYEPQFDPSLDAATIGEHAFRKHLGETREL